MLSSIVYWKCCVIKALIPWCFPSALAPALSASSSTEFCEPWRKEFDGYVPFRVNVIRSVILCTLSRSESLYMSLNRRKNFLWGQMNKALTYKYSRMSLGVIVWLCFFGRTVAFGSTLCPSVSDLWSPKQSWKWVQLHVVVLKFKQILVVNQKSLWRFCPSVTFRQITIVDKKTCSWVGDTFFFSFASVQSTFQ